MTQTLQILLQNLLQFTLRNMDDLVHLAIQILEEFGHPNLLGKLYQRPMPAIRMFNHLDVVFHQANL